MITDQRGNSRVRQMGWVGWFRRKSHVSDERLVAWRRAWSAVATAVDPEGVPALRRDLEQLSLAEEEIELEREMLDGLERAAALSREIDAAGLPDVETGHRIVGSERCHFSAPAFIPDDHAQPSGRVLLTARRAIFAGGAATIALAWHTIGEAAQADRDLILVTTDRQRLLRFRCNTYADALCGAVIARRLSAAARRRL